MEYYRGNELYHHGIKGQRWGVRRFQNPDGSLTKAGKSRYSEGKIIAKEHTAAYYDHLEKSQKRSKAYQKALKENERLTDQYDLDNRRSHSNDSDFYKKEREWAAQKRWSNADDMDSLNRQFEEKAEAYANKLITDKYGSVGLSNMHHYQAVNAGVAFAATLATAGAMSLLLKKL